MKIVQIVAIAASVSAKVNEGYPCVDATDCVTPNSECCNSYKAGDVNRKICWSPSTTSGVFGNVAPANYYTKACAVATADATKVAIQAMVSVLSVAYMT